MGCCWLLRSVLRIGGDGGGAKGDVWRMPELHISPLEI